MVLNDTLSNALSNMLNCEKVGRSECTIHPTSKIIKDVLNILNANQYVGSFEEIEDNKGNSLKINLLGGINKCGAIKPRFSVSLDEYEKFEKRFLPARNIGIMIISTSQGIMTHIEAKNKKLGGKLIAYCY